MGLWRGTLCGDGGMQCDLHEKGGKVIECTYCRLEFDGSLIIINGTQTYKCNCNPQK